MDEKEKTRRMAQILRNVRAELTRAKARPEGVGLAIAELGAMYEDAANGVDLTTEKDRKKSCTRKVRRALGYTVP